MEESFPLPDWPSKVLFLRPLDVMADLATEQMARAWRRAGREVAWSVLLREGETPRQAEARVRGEVEQFAPELCVVNGGMGFHAPSLYLHGGPLHGIPVAALWFDDPYRATRAFSRRPGYIEALRSASVVHWVWDGYWREWLSRTWGVASRSFHLAADPEDYGPLPRQAEYGEALVFVGTLADPGQIACRMNRLPPVVRKAAAMLERSIAAAPYRANPFDVWSDVFESLAQPLRQGVEDAFGAVPDMESELMTLAWQWGKNVTRLRALRAAVASGAELLLLCGNLEANVAGAAEIRGWLGEARVHVQNTCDVSADRLQELYAWGRLHFQATDPQSRWGGIPFRAFHTAACGRPLFSDTTQELVSCFAPEKEMAFFENETDLVERLRFWLSRPEDCEEMGRAARARFLREHTWRHRWSELSAGMREEQRCRE
jgi:glycosyltransferase involved in cell wall biosynthesis